MALAVWWQCGDGVVAVSQQLLAVWWQCGSMQNRGSVVNTWRWQCCCCMVAVR